MSPPRDRPSELSLLMELRLVFGPGTRLWAYRSREELCYDWLYFKARSAPASFREFALSLYIQEKEQGLPCANLSAIRRRVSAVLKAYRVKKRYRNASLSVVPASPSSGSGLRARDDQVRQLISRTELPIPPVLIPNGSRTPLRSRLGENEVAR
jgi:hypothetical protein